jgi:HEPN domain-containing protein
MNTRLMALDYINRARRCLKESKAAFDDEDYPITVRRGQECVELRYLREVLQCTVTKQNSFLHLTSSAGKMRKKLLHQQKKFSKLVTGQSKKIPAKSLSIKIKFRVNRLYIAYR